MKPDEAAMKVLQEHGLDKVAIISKTGRSLRLSIIAAIKAAVVQERQKCAETIDVSPGQTTPAEVRIRLRPDGTIYIINSGAGSLWCAEHGKFIQILLGNQVSSGEISDGAAAMKLAFSGMKEEMEKAGPIIDQEKLELEKQPTFQWKNRTVKFEDDLWFMSAVGDPTNWDYAPEKIHPGIAIAGSFDVGSKIASMEVLDEDRLLVRTDGRDYVIIGDPMDGGRIEPYLEGEEVKPDDVFFKGNPVEFFDEPEPDVGIGE